MAGKWRLCRALYAFPILLVFLESFLQSNFLWSCDVIQRETMLLGI